MAGCPCSSAENLLIINSTFSGNQVTGGGRDGAGMWLWDNTGSPDPVTIINSTITDNTANSGTSRGGGVALAVNAKLEIHNTIVAENSAGTSGYDDGDGALESTSTYNLLGAINNGSAGVTHDVDGNQLGVSDAGLAALGNYGGSTLTHALLADSGAIDAGSLTGLSALAEFPSFDQRGFARYVDAVDIGAFEFGAPLVVTLPTDEDDGDYAGDDFSIREALALAELLEGVDTIKFDPSVQEIVLSTDQLTIDTDLFIEGPGADQLAISGNDQFRVFVINSGATVSIKGLTITEGTTTGRGGGISNDGGLTLDSVMVIDNHSTGTIGGTTGGGGIYTSGNDLVIIVNSSIVNNTSIYEGGGLRGHNNRDNLVIINSTFSGNEVTGSNRDGGGSWLWDNSGSLNPVTIVNSTVTDNTTTRRGGGVGLSSAKLEIHNTIIADNFAGTTGFEDGDGALESTSTYNLLGAINNGTAGVTNGVDGNQVGVSDAGLADLDDYGGGLLTHALLNGSLAIDAGNNLFAFIYDLDGDQRGFGRLADGNEDSDIQIDIGAFELALAEDWGSV